MKDLVAVFKVLNICADRIDEHPLYIDPMVSIVRLCGLPFLKEKSSDEIAFEQIAVESVAQLGKTSTICTNYSQTFLCSHLFNLNSCRYEENKGIE